MLTRRRWLSAGVGALAGACAPALRAAPVGQAVQRARIVIPANAGGGWDQTGRALGAALVACGAAGEVVYENIGGKGGTIGLTQYVQRYSDQGDTLLMGGMVMVGAIALQKPAVDLRQVRPLARLTSDYLVVVVPAGSPYQSAKDLAEAMRTDLPKIAVAGGSAGGVDHMFAGVLARAAKARPEHLRYLPFAGGADVVKALIGGQAQVGISGYSEFSDALAAGQLRAIGVSARKPMYGIEPIRQQGVDADMANWRAVFTGGQVPAARRAQWTAAIGQAVAHEQWQRSLSERKWDNAWQTGDAFEHFLDMETMTAQVMTFLLKLKR